MKKHYLSIAPAFAGKVNAAALFVALWTSYCHAEAVTDWRTYRAAGATTLGGQGTDDPVLGSIASSSQASFMLGYLTTPAVLGANEGDFVRLTFGVTFTDGAPAQGVGDNFRFALFDLNGEAQDSATGGAGGDANYGTAGTSNTDDFRGYWFGNKGGGGAGNNGSIRERDATLTAATDNPFTNNATDPAPSLGPVGGVNVPLFADGTSYVGELKLTRTAGGLIDLSGILKNSSDVGNEFAASDTTGASLPSTFGAVAFLNGNGLSFDQVNFTDVNVTVGSSNLPGDHNADGVVDASDYVAWRKQTPEDDEGYGDFFEHFGEPGSGGSPQAATGVPEPAVLGLVAIAAMILLGFARGRRAEFARACARRSVR